ncbi:PDZ domain-containing protein [Streptomonospora sp. PA3]|uniref:S1C family serine protease n=1 Tax=Streptomonospora sp. PA3 TaxID=2607326 RepID=UPI0012DD2811|nr:trypsin-like peptidase domain-containing protein [Streptomonospora sp. PA3]MUL43911.1 PDZ domain-containing protein [Streptomonospora sp. PA3]
MSASDPNKGFPTGDQDGGGRPAEPAEASADPARSGADPASSAERADHEPQTGGNPRDAEGGEPVGGAAETTARWRSSVANRPARSTPQGAAEQGGDEAPAADENRPEPPQDPRDGTPSQDAPSPYAPGAHPADARQPGGHEQPGDRAPYGPPPGPGGPGHPGHHGHHAGPGGYEAAAWSGTGAGAPGSYGPGPEHAGSAPGGWHPGSGGRPGDPGYGGYPPPPPGEGHPGGPYGEQPRRPSFLRRNKVLLVAAVTALITSLIVGPAAAAVTAFFVEGAGSTSALTGDSEGSVSSGDVSKVADRALPSVVSIQAGQGAGSGVIISSDGNILTNAHVVAAAEGDSVTVSFQNGDEAQADILGSDPVSDLAVIKAQDVSGLSVADLGNSDKVEVGADVVAIGSPLGLQGTVTSGVVSALDRPVNTGASAPEQQPQNPFAPPEQQQEQELQTSTVINAIQTDAPINPGNSGGPLMNMSGEVIGINTAIASTGASGQAGSIGLGFAIPINQAKPIAQQLIEDGQASYAAIQATITDQRRAEGATIVETTDGGAAAKAGLERGDRITHVNGKEVEGPNALIAAIRAHQPGDTITIGYVRDGEHHETEVTLAAQSSDSLNG